jgi:hypothetical protein
VFEINQNERFSMMETKIKTGKREFRSHIKRKKHWTKLRSNLGKTRKNRKASLLKWPT